MSSETITKNDLAAIIAELNLTDPLTDMTATEIDNFIQALSLHGTRTICPYDIGDIYETTNSSNPSTKWGGTTWNLLSEAGDYIVEEGTSGIWTYRKWASGIAECWGTKNDYTITSFSSWGNVYSNDLSGVSYPNELFISAPNILAQSNGTSGANTWSSVEQGGTATYTPGVITVRANNVSNSTYRVFYRAIGLWKTRITPQTIYRWRRES